MTGHARPSRAATLALEDRARVVAALAHPYLSTGRLIPLHVESEMRAITTALRAMREKAEV